MFYSLSISIVNCFACSNDYCGDEAAVYCQFLKQMEFFISEHYFRANFVQNFYVINVQFLQQGLS